MKLIFSKLPIFIAILAIVSCKEVSNEVVKEAPAPSPVKVYTNQDISVKAYEYEGLQYFLNRDNDTTYVINFWATWCVPCIEELPYFEKLNTKYKEDKVKVLLVSLDMRKMIESKLMPFLKEKQLKSDVIVMTDPDANSWIPKIDSTWSGAIPATIIYNKEKRKFYEQSFTYDGLETELLSIK
ncbi:TlpA family protein disulfide reductase [Flavobacterium salilacus subsp. salilacus]|uniref:TlpA disulfide reductase family protein n=1 Tax=Flavobacterium TaxID=237 RepID=UPI001074B1CB|nr:MULTISPECIES: TlpA disulfide reductase family protein [Flavobacterium]KAF2519108.1 TlpA family protein disulfide reductase [Flavobacterium salilacus subsp. salilacus]MBE1613286.1 TlpA family protein disulfide reductase [Flavobacterium sp. SaA2.13]